SQATAPALLLVSAAVKDKTTPSVTSTGHGGRSCGTTGITAAATNTSLGHRTASTQVTATSASAATSTQRAGHSTRSQRQTTGTGSTTAMAAVTSTTATPAGTQTSPARTVRPPPGPEPSPIPTGTYTVSDGNGTCVKAVMGLQLMARNTEQEQIEYVTVNPNATQISGSCGVAQSELNLTFSGGFVNFTFVK
ncbi:LAMP3 protein, partial [Origma solitaria]|nr:LAMP3 protein [Origma solitaria]